MVRRITPDDASLLREVRLRALADSPGAFGSTYAREAAFDPTEWQARAQRSSQSNDAATFFAFEGNEPQGIIGCFRSTERPNSGHVVSMWVAPQARRKGIGRRLIQAIEQWARDQRLPNLVLDVVENNVPAIEFYEEYGFRRTGETEQYPNDPTLREILMIKSVG